MKLLQSTFFLLLSVNCINGQSSGSKSRLINALDSLNAASFKEYEPGGVVLVAQRGEVIYRKAFGMANMELNVPANDSMIFYIGSNTKQFTAVAILQLVEKAKLKLADTLGKFIPLAGYPVSSITVLQLLSHTSGIVNNNEADVKKLLAGQKTPVAMDFAPGAKWEYNNTNYSLLGFIIEKITGRSYVEYVNENIFKPAGMTHSYVDEEMSIIRNRAPGYKYFKARIQNSRPSGKIGASGGIQSTVDDMLNWNQALRTGTVLSLKMLQQALTPQSLLNGAATAYGFGWHLEKLHGSPTHRHGGMVPGYTSETLYLPQEDVYVVILTNAEFSPVPITALSRVIAGMAIGKPYIFHNMAIDKNELKKFIGLYENAYGELLNITEQEGGIVFQRPNGTRYYLGYAGNNEFFFPRDFLRVHFITGQAGKITSLQFSKVDVDMTEWFKTQNPPLKLSAGRIEDSILRQYAGQYFLPGSDTITIVRDGVSLYYKANNIELLLAAEDNFIFFSIKNNLRVRFIKDPVSNSLTLSVTQNKQRRHYMKL